MNIINDTSKPVSENADDLAIMILDKEGIIKTCNKGTETIKGYKPNEIIGKNMRIFYSGEDVLNHLLEKNLAQAIQNGFCTNEGWRVRKDGTLFWGKIKIVAIYDNKNSISGFTKIVSYDQNNKHNTEVGDCNIVAEISTNDLYELSSLTALINNTHDLMWSIDRNYKLITANNSFNELVQHMTGNIIERGESVFINGFTENEIGRYKDWYDRALVGESFKVTDYTGVPVELWSELSFYPIYNGSEIIGTACYSHNITERKRENERTKLAVANLKAVFENSSDSLLITDVNGSVLTFNDNAEENVLLTNANKLQVGQNFFENIDASRKEVFLNMISEVKEGRSIQYDQSAYDLTGKYHCYNFSIYPIKEDGKIIGICFNGRDITDSTLARESIQKNEKRLEEEKQKYTELFTQAPSCICILKGPEFVYEMANPLYLQLTRKSNVIGKKAIEVFPELVDQGFVELLKSVYISGVPFAANEQFIQIDLKGDGKLTDHYMNFVYQPYKNDEGIAEGIFFFANVVTEQVEARKEIERNEKYFRALVENAGDIISLADKNGNISYVTPSFEKITGYSANEIIGVSYFSIMEPDSLEEAQTFFAQMINSPGIPIERTNCFIHKNGNKIWVEGTVTNLLHDDNVAGVVGNFRDITERKQAEIKIINANRLYAFTSGINQAIAHAENERALFKQACRIATETGKFKMAWVSLFDQELKRIYLVDFDGIPGDDLNLLHNIAFDNGGPQHQVLQNSKYWVCNDLQNDLDMISWKQYVSKCSLRSCMILPIRKGGRVIGTFNLSSSMQNLFDDQEIRLLSEIADDISFAMDVFEKEKDRKEAEEKLIHNKQRMKQAQAIAHVGSWELDFATGVAKWSEESCRIYGLSQDDNLHSYEKWLSYIHPDDLEQINAMTDEMNKTLSSRSCYHRIITPDGVVKNILSEAHFELNDKGIPVGLYGVAHDITDIKQAEAALAKSEANLRLILDVIPQAIFAKNTQGQYIFANKSFAKLYGMSPEELIGKSKSMLIDEKADAENSANQDLEIVNTGKAITIPEYTFVDQNDSERQFNVLKMPYDFVGMQEKAVLGIAMDITDQKHQEAERTKMITDIVQRNKDLEQFSYIVSHNLRAPVANIMGLTDIMKLPDIDLSNEKELIDSLSLSVKKLDEVIMDLNYILQVKHKESKKNEWVTCTKLLSDIEFSIANLIKSENASIISDFRAIDRLFTVRSYLYSVFFNLITNSIKYRQPDVSPVIEISSAIRGNKVLISIKDNGLGIDLNKRGDQVFGLYKRFHDHVDGKGVGLYMVKTQIESLGGSISITSEPNKGTTFIIELELK